MKRLKDATPTSIRNRLEKWIQLASERDWGDGLSWYNEAQEFTEFVASHYRLNPFTVACALSVLSPNNKWERNKLDTISCIEAYLRGECADSVKCCTYNANKYKAFNILKGDVVLNSISIKTNSFAHNVALLSDKYITVDKWMIRAALLLPREKGKPCQESCTAKQYRVIEDEIRKLSVKYHVKGYQLQAIIWIAIRNNWK